MAWLWKQGRPTLVMQGQASWATKRCTGDARRWGRNTQPWGCGTPTAHPSRTTSTPAAPPTQTGFLSGLSVKDLATRIMKEVREDDCLAGPRSSLTICCLPSFPFFSL